MLAEEEKKVKREDMRRYSCKPVAEDGADSEDRGNILSIVYDDLNMEQTACSVERVKKYRVVQ